MGGGRRCIWILASFVILVFLADTTELAFAQDSWKQPEPSWTVDHTYSLLSTVTISGTQDGSNNSDNFLFRLPKEILISSEFRQDSQARYGDRHRLILRPRLKWEQALRSRAGETDSVEYDFDVFVNEGYFVTDHNPNLHTVIGLQNFQWGPAELAGPSNPMFRDLAFDKTFFFETRGISLLRMNYSPNRQFSLILMAEPIDNGAKTEAHEPEFRSKALVKIEYADSTLTNYIGLVLAIIETDRLQQGIYLNYEVFAGFTAYIDMISRFGSRAFYPVAEGRFEQNRLDSDKLELTSVAGLRYVTSSGWDIRLEGFLDDNGWTLEEQELARAVVASDPSRDNIEIYVKPGTLLPGREFAYVSIMKPSFGWKRSLNFASRTLYSLSDSTARSQMTLDTHFGNNLVGNIGALVGYGPKDGELTQGYQWTTFVAVAATW